LGKIEYSPDGKRLIAGDYPGGTVIVYEVATGKQLTKIETGSTNRGSERYFFVTPDWRTIYDSQSKRTLEEINIDGVPQRRWAFDGSVRAWDLETGKSKESFKHVPPRSVDFFRSRSACSAARWRSPRRSRCTRGFPTRWKARTPVSALIHAATMVTAGVYLIVRCHPLFENAYVIEDLAAGLGAATLLMAGLIALVQTDIKRVIAYSTMSQIGYMFRRRRARRVPERDVPLDDARVLQGAPLPRRRDRDSRGRREQDIRKLAGVGKLMPFTKWVFLVGSLALVGIFPFAGFFFEGCDHRRALDHGWYGDVIYGVCASWAPS